MGTQIFCTDCHNSDDNREFGGRGSERSARIQMDTPFGAPVRIQPGAGSGPADYQPIPKP
jgi:hypothetical protein